MKTKWHALFFINLNLKNCKRYVTCSRSWLQFSCKTLSFTSVQWVCFWINKYCRKKNKFFQNNAQNSPSILSNQNNIFIFNSTKLVLFILTNFLLAIITLVYRSNLSTFFDHPPFSLSRLQSSASLPRKVICLVNFADPSAGRKENQTIYLNYFVIYHSTFLPFNKKISIRKHTYLVFYAILNENIVLYKRNKSSKTGSYCVQHSVVKTSLLPSPAT